MLAGGCCGLPWRTRSKRIFARRYPVSLSAVAGLMVLTSASRMSSASRARCGRMRSGHWSRPIKRAIAAAQFQLDLALPEAAIDLRFGIRRATTSSEGERRKRGPKVPRVYQGEIYACLKIRPLAVVNNIVRAFIHIPAELSLSKVISGQHANNEEARKAGRLRKKRQSVAELRHLARFGVY